MVSLTRTGIWLLLGTCAVLLLGVALRAPEWLVWPVIGWATLGWAYLQHLRTLDDLEHGRVAIALEPSEGGDDIACVRGQGAAMTLRVSNGTSRLLRSTRVHLPSIAGLGWSGALEPFTLAGASLHRVRVEFRAERTGRWPVRSIEVEVSDMLGIFGLRTRVSVDLRVTVVPGESFAPGTGRASVRARMQAPEGGPDSVAVPGEGSELREIRAYTTSDAYSRIAWKASARTGQLMVREHEDEVPGTTVCVLDVSSTMRGGHGAQRLEYAFSVAMVLLARTRAARDRIGLVAFDDAVVGRLSPASGTAHAQRFVAQLVALANLPSPGLDEGDEDTVLAAVADWARTTLRLDFRSAEARRALAGTGERAFDTRLLQHWISTRRGEEIARLRQQLLECGVLATGLSEARLLASIEQIPLGLRTSPRLGSKELPLATAIREASALARDPARVVVISDLSAVLDPAAVVAAIGEAGMRRHDVGFVVPFVPAFEAIATSPDDALHAGFVWAEREERARLVRVLRAAGANVLVVGPQIVPTEAVRALSRPGSQRRPSARR